MPNSPTRGFGFSWRKTCCQKLTENCENINCSNPPCTPWLYSVADCCRRCAFRIIYLEANRNVSIGKYEKALDKLSEAEKIASERDNNNQLLEVSSLKLDIYMNYIKNEEKAKESWEEVRVYSNRISKELGIPTKDIDEINNIFTPH